MADESINPATEPAASEPSLDANSNPPATPQQPEWPDDWRDRFAGEDKTFRRQLERYASPVDLARKARSLERKLSSGEYRRDLPANASEEDRAAWRAERALPENADGYIAALNLSNGLVLGEADKPVISEFAAAAFSADMDPGHFSALVDKYYELQDRQRADRAEADMAFHNESLSALNTEWGALARREINGVNAFIGQYFPQEMAAGLLSARTPDGRMLGDNPAFIRAIAALNRQVNPVSTLVPAGGNDPTASIGERLAEIRKLQGDGSSDYWRGPKAEGLQREYLDLLTEQERAQGKKNYERRGSL